MSGGTDQSVHQETTDIISFNCNFSLTEWMGTAELCSHEHHKPFNLHRIFLQIIDKISTITFLFTFKNDQIISFFHHQQMKIFFFMIRPFCC